MADSCSISPQIISGAVIAAIGWFAGYFSAKRIANINTKNTASAKFRLSFYNELANLCDWTVDVNPADILMASFNKHFIAVLEFSYFLGETDRNTFIAEWNQHYQDEHISHKYYPDFSKYSTLGVSISRAKEIRETAIKNIEHLLSFANQA